MSKEREMKIKDAYLQKIIDIGNYDENTTDISHLKNIIDVLVNLAEKGLIMMIKALIMLHLKTAKSIIS